MTPPPSLRRIRDDDELLDVLGGRLADPADELSAVLGDWARSIDRSEEHLNSSHLTA